MTAFTLETVRLRLVAATRALVESELDDPLRLARNIGADLPQDWPPEHHNSTTLQFTRTALDDPGAAGWWLHYLVLIDAPRPALVGVAGYKGPPTNGVAEVGYSVVPSRRRQGIATEACQALVEGAWQRGASVVVAETHPHLEPSIRVLRKLGFTPAPPREPGVLAFSLTRPTGLASSRSTLA